MLDAELDHGIVAKVATHDTTDLHSEKERSSGKSPR